MIWRLLDRSGGPWGVAIVVVAMAAVLGAISGGLAWLRADAARDATAACEARVQLAREAERRRQDAIAAEERLAQDRQVAEIVDAIRQQSERIEGLNAEAETDPRARSCGLSADGLRRVNRS